MGILDDAIREHLALKRQHGAGDDELQTLEGEAFGPTERPGDGDAKPDALAEAPTEFMEQPDAAGQSPDTAGPEESDSIDIKVRKSSEPEQPKADRGPEIADLQEGPEQEPGDRAPEPADQDLSSAPPPEPAEEEAPAMEHKAIAEPEKDPPEPQGPSTEEREAIADPPTEIYDVEGEEFGAESPAPSDEELVEEEIAEPRLAPVEPLTNLEGVDDEGDGPDFAVTETGGEPAGADAEEDEEDFFDEKRLSDELDQALDMPLEAPEEDLEPADEAPAPEPEPESEESPTAAPQAADEDVLEETPDFLEEAPEDDQLWFEQKPPKDFDFDD